jgi:hypothetical protein
MMWLNDPKQEHPNATFHYSDDPDRAKCMWRALRTIHLTANILAV